MKNFIVVLLGLFIASISYAQHDLYIGAELNGGVLIGNEFNDNILNQKNYSPTTGAQLSASIRLFDFIGIEAGIGQHWSRIRLNDEDFENETDDFSIKIKNSFWHWNYYAALATYFKIKGTDTYVYGKFGISQNIYGSAQVSKSEDVGISRLNIERRLDYQTSYQESNVSYLPEIGVQHKFYKGNLMSLGLRYNLGQSEAFSSQYTVTDKQTQSRKTDQLSAKGDALSLMVRYDFRIYHIDKKEKVKKLNLEDVKLDVRKKDSLPHNDATGSSTNEDRELVVRDKIKVYAPRVKILIWDHQTVDGDRVSLKLNENWILENYALKKEKYEVEVELEEGLNTFVLHALNLGEIKPNTAALIVDDGKKKHRITLQSNFKESGTLQIKYKKR